MLQSSVIEDSLCLVVSPRDDVPHSSQSGGLDLHLAVGEEGDQFGHDAAVYHHLDLLVAPVSEVGQSPDGVHKDVDV